MRVTGSPASVASLTDSNTQVIPLNFLFPIGLLALLTLPLIVLLHLIRERRRRMVVPSLLLWELLPQRQDAQRRRRLPLTWLLLLHLLIVALLALALGQPRWLANLFGAERHIVLVLDLSTSMAANDPALGGAARLDAARSRAQALIGELGDRDTVALVTAGPQAQVVVPPAPAGTLAAAQALETLVVEGNGADIEGAILLAQAALEDQPTGEVIVLTDGALPDLAADLAEQIQPFPVRWEVLGGSLDNRAVVTLAARPRGGASAGGAMQLYARVANYGANPSLNQVRLLGDGRLLDTRRASLDPDGETEFAWTLPAGLSSVRVELDGNDRFPTDDSAELSLAQVRPVVAVLISNNPALERALQAVPGLDVRLIGAGEYAAAEPAADLTIFDGVLPQRWPIGGVLVINPPLNREPLLPTAGRDRPDPEASLVTLAPGLFDGLSLGSVDFGAPRVVEAPEWAQVALQLGETPLVLRGRVERSEIAVWSFDINEGNLTSRLAFPLLVARTVRDLTPASLPGSITLGTAINLRPGPRAEQVQIIAPDGSTSEVALEQTNQPQLQAQQTGLYTIVERAGSTELFRGSVAVNAGSSAESPLSPRRLPTLPSAATAASVVNEEPEQAGQPFWPWLAVGALAIFMFEWVYSHVRRPQAG
jgi:Ca-activated chloride channel homolog